MRQDLAKVICEDARRGSRDYMGGRKGYAAELRFRVAADRDRDHSELECLPGHESMRGRLSGNRRRFSENLGALRGIILSAIGQPWDDVYGKLCQLVSPTGSNIERHVHQHLNDFLLMRTRLGVAGVEYSDRSGGNWTLLTAQRDWRWRRQPCYVHPLSRLVLRVPEPVRREMPPARRFVLPGDGPLSRYAQLKGIWYELLLEPATYRLVPGATGDAWQLVVRDCAIIQLAKDVPDSAQRPGGASGRLDLRSEQDLRVRLYGQDLVAISKQGLNHRALKRLGLKNDAIA